MFKLFYIISRYATSFWFSAVAKMMWCIFPYDVISIWCIFHMMYFPYDVNIFSHRLVEKDCQMWLQSKIVLPPKIHFKCFHSKLVISNVFTPNWPFQMFSLQIGLFKCFHSKLATTNVLTPNFRGSSNHLDLCPSWPFPNIFQPPTFRPFDLFQS